MDEFALKSLPTSSRATSVQHKSSLWRQMTKINEINPVEHRDTCKGAGRLEGNVLSFVTHLERCRRWLVDWLLRPPPALSPPPALIVTRDDIFDLNNNWTPSMNDTTKFLRFAFRRASPTNGSILKRCVCCDIVCQLQLRNQNGFSAFSFAFCFFVRFVRLLTAALLTDSALDVCVARSARSTHSLLLFYRAARH